MATTSGRDLVLAVDQAKRRAAEAWQGTVDRLKTKLKAVEEHQEVVVGQMVTSAEIQAAAFGVGYLRGRFGDRMTVAGMPLELVAGVAGHLAGLTMLSSDSSREYVPYVHAAADGALAAWAAQQGRELGARGRQSAASAGYAPPGYAFAYPVAPPALPAVAGGEADSALADAIELMQAQVFGSR